MPNAVPTPGWCRAIPSAAPKHRPKLMLMPIRTDLKIRALQLLLSHTVARAIAIKIADKVTNEDCLETARASLQFRVTESDLRRALESPPLHPFAATVTAMRP